MDPGPPDSKRQRIASWSSSSHGVSLPRPHSTNSPLPPPRAPNHHHPAAPYHHYPPRPPEPHSSGPPTPVHPSTPSQVHPEAERRHHEQEAYAPMQDHYQHHHHPSQPIPQHHHPPASPAHGAYHPYQPREPVPVKREPAEDPHRPNSTGHASEAPPPPPSASSHHSSTSHQPLPPPQAYAEGQQRHMSYDNVHSVPPTPGGYRPHNYPPPTPTPLSQQASYEPHPSYSDAAYYGVAYSSSLPAKKKNTRASQACDQCRQLKAKCDETKPCKTCRDKGLECKYRDPIPKATDKAQTDILDGILTMQSTLSTLTDHIGRVENRLTKMESVFAHNLGPSPVKSDPAAVAEAHARIQSPRVQSPVMANGGSDSLETVTMESRNTEAGSGSMERYAHEPSSLESYYQQDPSREVRPPPDQVPPLRMMVEDEVEAEPGPPVPPGEPAIPINHTTLAGLLLEWPTIRELTKHHLEREGIRYISEFPISQEQNRGPLIVYGRGEDAHHSRYSREPTEHGNVEMADDSSDMASPSPAADFGQLGGLSPSDMIEYRGGVLGADGNPDFSEAKVKVYVQSFKDNILNMHPIVQPKLLDYWVQHFLDTLPTTQPRSTKPQVVKPTFAIANPQHQMDSPGAKRKRSPEPDSFDGPQTAPPGKAGKPDRSIHSALILTVLALGKICLYRDNIPDVVHPTDQIGPTGSPIVRNGIPQSPGQSSPPSQSSHSHHSAQPSPRDASDRSAHSRRPSIHGSTGYRSGYNLKKNYEVIPGLEYFAYATDILGNLAGAYNNMKDVYANIFACLYYGQLSRPLESFAFIHKASHKLQVIMRPSLDKLRNFKKRSEFIQEPKYNQLALAFWTCLQLESDLIAELPLPPSGLLSYEEDMPHPNMSLLQGFDQRVLDSYPGQLYLRTHLNSIHRMFYAPEDPSKSGPDKFRNVELVADAVSGMHWVAPSFAFREDDDPAEDILGARLRAKYWGAQMITYRPFIRQILQFTHSINNHPSSPNPPTYTEFRDGIIAPVIHPGTKTLSEIDPSVIELARKGIKALIESTRAFHNVVSPNRPIITNVFGTAHAQWGNMLVLSAAKKDTVLGKYIDDDVLETLFNRTIGFLRQSAGMTSSLRIDMHILEGLQRDIMASRRQKSDNQDSASFSSNAGVQTPVIAPSSAPMQRTHSTDQSLGSQLRQSAPPPGS